MNNWIPCKYYYFRTNLNLSLYTLFSYNKTTDMCKINSDPGYVARKEMTLSVIRLFEFMCVFIRYSKVLLECMIIGQEKRKSTAEWNKVISPLPSPPGINYQLCIQGGTGPILEVFPSRASNARCPPQHHVLSLTSLICLCHIPISCTRLILLFCGLKWRVIYLFWVTLVTS